MMWHIWPQNVIKEVMSSLTQQKAFEANKPYLEWWQQSWPCVSRSKTVPVSVANRTVPVSAANRTIPLSATSAHVHHTPATGIHHHHVPITQPSTQLLQNTHPTQTQYFFCDFRREKSSARSCGIDPDRWLNQAQGKRSIPKENKS